MFSLSCIKFFSFLLFVLLSLGCGGSWDLSSQTSLQNSVPQVTETFPSSHATLVGVNLKPMVIFSQPMDSSTFDRSTFSIKLGNQSVAGTVIVSGYSATFVPKNALPVNASLTATVNTHVRSLVDGKSGANLQNDYVWTFKTGSFSDNIQPVVSIISPENSSTDVPLNRKIGVVFSKFMDPNTLSQATFFLQSGTVLVSGSISTIGLVSTFTPKTPLRSNTLHTATVSVASQDLSGNTLNTNFSWSFTTGSTLDTTAPAVINVLPSDKATQIPTNFQATATFSEVMDPATISTKTFYMEDANANLVKGNISFIGKFASFQALSALDSNQTYTVTILSGAEGVKDLAGNALVSDYKWTFTTMSSSQTAAPTTLVSSPTNNAQGSCLQVPILLSFDSPMNGATITPSNYTVTGPSTQNVVGTVSFNSSLTEARFIPLASLSPNTLYTVFVRGGSFGVGDLYGNAMSSNYQWIFTTGTEACSQ